MHKNSLDNNDPEEAFYVWKNADVQNEIKRLFAGEKVKFFADIKQSRNNSYNAIKFNAIDLVFRSSNNITNGNLNEILNYFEVHFIVHSGVSDFRCNNYFYKITSQPALIMFSLAKNEHQIPLFRNGVYSKLKENRPMLSPYTLWEIQLEVMNPHIHGKRFRNLDSFVDQVDMELHGTGEYISENASICNNSNLAKFYMPM